MLSYIECYLLSVTHTNCQIFFLGIKVFSEVTQNVIEEVLRALHRKLSDDFIRTFIQRVVLDGQQHVHPLLNHTGGEVRTHCPELQTAIVWQGLHVYRGIPNSVGVELMNASSTDESVDILHHTFGITGTKTEQIPHPFLPTPFNQHLFEAHVCCDERNHLWSCQVLTVDVNMHPTTVGGNNLRANLLQTCSQNLQHLTNLPSFARLVENELPVLSSQTPISGCPPK